jgi:hypothetical protein
MTFDLETGETRRRNVSPAASALRKVLGVDGAESAGENMPGTHANVAARELEAEDSVLETPGGGQGQRSPRRQRGRRGGGKGKRRQSVLPPQ